VAKLKSQAMYVKSTQMHAAGAEIKIILNMLVLRAQSPEVCFVDCFEKQSLYTCPAPHSPRLSAKPT
jgi:hypothetical protein